MKRMDYVLIAFLLVLSGVLFIFVRPGGAAATATVYHNGQAVQTLTLAKDDTYTWREGENFVTIQVENDAVRVTDASCPDKDCVHRGFISRSGQSIVCLPNHLSVVLENGEAEYDALLY